MQRDDFTQPTKDRLAKRAGYLCSNPECRQLTIGAAPGNDDVVNLGVAAHITAASPGGKRYDAGLSRDERTRQSNGIWLCQNCAKLVDSDEDTYTVEKLNSWRLRAERSTI